MIFLLFLTDALFRFVITALPNVLPALLRLNPPAVDSSKKSVPPKGLPQFFGWIRTRLCRSALCGFFAHCQAATVAGRKHSRKGKSCQNNQRIHPSITFAFGRSRLPFGNNQATKVATTLSPSTAFTRRTATIKRRQALASMTLCCSPSWLIRLIQESGNC